MYAARRTYSRSLSGGSNRIVSSPASGGSNCASVSGDRSVRGGKGAILVEIPGVMHGPPVERTFP